MTKKLGTALLSALCGIFFAGFLNLFYASFGWTVTEDPEAAANYFGVFRDSKALLILIQAFGAPLLEEFLFRKLLYGKLRIRLNPIPAALISAAFFGVLHFSILGGIYGFLFGLLAAELMERGRTWWFSVLAHMFANLFSLMINEVASVNDYLTANAIWTCVLSGILLAGSFLLFIHGTDGFHRRSSIE